MEEFVAIGKKRNKLPTMNDCAADVPPIENLLKPDQAGFRSGSRIGWKSDSRPAVRRHSRWTRGPDPGRSEKYVAELRHDRTIVQSQQGRNGRDDGRSRVVSQR